LILKSFWFVRELIRLYALWHRVAGRHLTYADNALCTIVGVNKVRDDKVEYTRIADGLGDVVQTINRCEQVRSSLMEQLNKQIHGLTH